MADGQKERSRNRAEIPCPSEDVEQTHLFLWAAFQEAAYPELGMMFAIPNGGVRNITTAKRLKATGVKAGVPDVFLPVPRGKYHGLWIEMKKRRGGRVSPEQKIWIQTLRDKGYRAEVCMGCDEAIATISEYLGI